MYFPLPSNRTYSLCINSLQSLAQVYHSKLRCSSLPSWGDWRSTRCLSIKTLTAWELRFFCNSENLWTRPQIKVWVWFPSPPPPPPFGEFFAYMYRNSRLPVPSFLIPWFCILVTVSISKGTRNEYTGSRRERPYRSSRHFHEF